MSTDLQLSELRRSLDVAVTKIDGQLTVLLQKSDYAEQRARESAERMAAELAARDARMAAHETVADAQELRMNQIEKDASTRMSQIERKMYFMMGVAATFGSAVGIVTTLVTKH